jgi:hypothetical protein
MLVFTSLLLVGQIAPVESKEFSKAHQTAGVVATVRVVNPRGPTGSGTIVGKSGPFVYVLTAEHLLNRKGGLEVQTFSEDSYPRPDKVYRSVEVIARSADIRDLAVIRIITADPLAALRICPPELIPKEKNLNLLSVGCSGGKAPTCEIHEVGPKKRVQRPPGKAAAFFWEVSQTPADGRSGGPLLDERRYLVGVCSGTSDGKGYYSHLEEIHSFLRREGLRWLFEEKKD